MMHYYAKSTTTGLIRVFTNKRSRDEWIARNPEKRTKLTNKESTEYRSYVLHHKIY